jgi:hypothetical protein
MKALVGAVLSGVALMIILLALVYVPAAAVVETRAIVPAAHPDPEWVDCSIRQECLR